MAASRPRVVVSEPDPGPPPDPPPDPRLVLDPSSVSASASSLHGKPSPGATPRASSPDSEYHYESPNEENHPSFFSGRSTPTPRLQQQAKSRHVESTQPSRPTRPVLLSRPSHMVAYAPPSPPNANSSGLDDIMSSAEKMAPGRKVGLKDRIACYQWTYFTMTMATGGVANTLDSLPSDAKWIYGIGVFFFLFNICLFILNCVMISMRFYLRPGSFTRSFTDQVESLFIPAFFVSIAIIMINICEYGVDHVGIWLLRIMEIMFWIYAALSTFASAGIYLILWSTLVFPVHMMTPTWVFPAYPLLLTAPFAGQLIAAAERSPDHGLVINNTAVALCAVTVQGTGTLIAFMISAAFIYRLMTQKLPRDMQRPGVFMSIGPYGFTAAGIAQLGSQAEAIIPPDFLGPDTGVHAVYIVRVMSILVALWLWGLAMWFFLVSVGSLWKYVRTGSSMPFQMTWWSFVFPNTALVTATQVMGQVFNSRGLQIAGSVLTAALIVVWIIVFFTMLLCLKQKKLLWPKDNS